MLLRFLRFLSRALLNVLRAVFLVLLLIIPIPVGELVVRLLDKYRRNQVTEIKRK